MAEESVQGTSINIPYKSLGIEINAHIFCGQVATIIRNSSSLPQNVKNAAIALCERTSVIDCGESSVDSNRWIWDAIAAVRLDSDLILSLP